MGPRITIFSEWYHHRDVTYFFLLFVSIFKFELSSKRKFIYFLCNKFRKSSNFTSRVNNYFISVLFTFEQVAGNISQGFCCGYSSYAVLNQKPFSTE